MENTDIDSYVVCSPGGHYHDYAKLNGLIKSHQHAVIKFSQFNKWYNEARFASSNLRAKLSKISFAEIFRLTASVIKTLSVRAI